MKTYTFRVKPQTRQAVLKEMEAVIKTGIPNIQKDEMLCDSMEVLLKAISSARMDAWQVIVRDKPESIYELSQILKKDQSNVLRDVRALESMGLIELKPLKDGEREKFRPQSLYERVVVIVEPGVEETPIHPEVKTARAG
ncbi:ArsR family transcriptional regulator [Bdellovibrionota bacterium FG-1]